ncbi:hypothetical protein [Sinomonas sp. G460-2]
MIPTGNGTTYGFLGIIPKALLQVTLGRAVHAERARVSSQA